MTSTFKVGDMTDRELCVGERSYVAVFLTPGGAHIHVAGKAALCSHVQDADGELVVGELIVKAVTPA